MLWLQHAVFVCFVQNQYIAASGRLSEDIEVIPAGVAVSLSDLEPT